MTDIEIAEKSSIKPIIEIAEKVGIPPQIIELYGNYKCKINIDRSEGKGKVVLVSAMTPTPLGEGKTTVSIGLADGLNKLGKKAIAALREPSLGPVFGMKGGACGGGYSQIIPMADINLHFNGDMHAITTANNLLSAMIDNHIYQGNELGIDPERVIWRRCLDLNDRNLRSITTGLGREVDGVTMSSGFDITAASEIMAILCLSQNIDDLKERMGKITVGYTFDGKRVLCSDLKAENAMAILFKDAIKPNLVQTLEGTPVFVHGGPFANIAHGCNSIIATRAGMQYGEYCITEAGFGADLGAEKFLDVKCRIADINPACVVLVATIKAIKYNAGVAKEAIFEKNADAIRLGFGNLEKHIYNITKVFNLPCTVAINRYNTDSEEEIALLKELCHSCGVVACDMRAYSMGGEGAIALAKEVVRLSDSGNQKLRYCYQLSDDVVTKLNKIVTEIYGGKGVRLSDVAQKQIAELDEETKKYPVIMAKTQYSFTDDPKILNRPKDFYIDIREIKIKSGAEFLVAIAGNIMLMPGLPKVPSAQGMFIGSDGKISGLS